MSDYRMSTVVFFKDPLEMNEPEIVSEVMQLRYDIVHIKSQLNADAEDRFLRGNDWRGRARKALRSKVARLHQLESFARGQRITVLFPDLADKAAKVAQDRLGQEEAAERRKVRADEVRQRQETHVRKVEEIATAKALQRATAEERNREQASMFVKAAHRLYSRDDCDKIWQKAREMFPDSPAWKLNDLHVASSAPVSGHA